MNEYSNEDQPQNPFFVEEEEGEGEEGEGEEGEKGGSNRKPKRKHTKKRKHKKTRKHK